MDSYSTNKVMRNAVFIYAGLVLVAPLSLLALWRLGDSLHRLANRRFWRAGSGDSRAFGRAFRAAVTRERIRQIEAKALRKLHTPERLRDLEGFLGCEGLSKSVGRHTVEAEG